MDIVSLLILKALSGGGGETPVATDVSYDNTTSGLNAENVQNALDELSSEKLNTSEKGSAGGVAELNENGIILTSQLPSYVDDVLEFPTLNDFPAQGESGKIYVDLSTNRTYRWGGSSYTEISPSLALGETSSTAYRGDRGKTAYDHSQLKTGNPHNVTKAQIGLGNVDNTSDANKPISTATQAALDTKLSEDDLCNMIEDSTVSGNPVTLKALVKTSAKSAKVTMLPIQSGSGDPSPTNIRPISGRDSVKLVDSGKNLFDIQHTALKKWAVVNQTFATVQDSSTRIVYDVKSDDTLEITVNNAYSGLGFMIEKSSETRRFSLISERAPYTVYLYTDYEDRATAITRSDVGGKELTIPPNTSGFLAFLYVSTFTATDNKLQLELGSTTTEYESYQGTTHTATFPSTVYGGSYEFVEGGLKENYGIIDLGTLTWDKQVSSEEVWVFRSSAVGAKLVANDVVANILCPIYKTTSNNNVVRDGLYSISLRDATKDGFRVYDTRYSDPTTFKTAMSGVYAAFELATSTTTALTPQSISLNKGDNVLTTDGDNAEIVYTELDLTELPDVTSADEGKVLTVNSSGEWVAQTLPDGTNISY